MFYVPFQGYKPPKDDDSEFIAAIFADLCNIIDSTERFREIVLETELDDAYAGRLIRDLKALAYDQFEDLIIQLISKDS